MEEGKTVSENAIRSLFIDRTEPEWLDVPGLEGCRFAFAPMAAAAKRAYLMKGMNLQISTDASGRAMKEERSDVQVDLAERHWILLEHSVVGWDLQATLRSPKTGEPVQATLRAPQRAEERRRILRAWYTGSDPKLVLADEVVDWLVEQCERINHLTEDDQGNSPAPSPN